MSTFFTPGLYYGIQACFDAAVLVIMILAAVDDGKTRTVRPGYQWALLAAALLHLVFEFAAYPRDVWNHGMHCVLGGVLMFAVYITAFLVQPSGQGGADTKVTSLVALFTGLRQAILTMVFHAVAALGYRAWYKRKYGKRVASVPLMVLIAIGYSATKILFWTVLAVRTVPAL